MAFRRYRPRRRFRPRRRPRRYYRRRWPTRRRGMIRRRRNVPRISPYDKKSDTMKPAHLTNDNDFSPIGFPNTFFLFCPTYRPAQLEDTPGATIPLARASSHIGYTGYKEVVNIATGKPLVWRRMVFWSFDRYVDAQPAVKDVSGVGTLNRNITPLGLGTAQQFFKGTLNVDFTANTLHQVPLDTNKCQVVSDRRRTLNPRYQSSDTYDFIFEQKFWYRGGKIIYDDSEYGSKVLEPSGWASLAPQQKGNLYILDMFTDAFSSTANLDSIARFSATGTAYWVEG